MYKGKNITALKSQEWIAKALINLLNKKELKNISIKEICMTCDLSRQTFYNLFESKQDVLSYIIHSLYNELYDEIYSKQNLQIKEIISIFINWVDKNIDLIQLLIKNHQEPLLYEEVDRFASIFANNFSILDKNDPNIKYLEAFLGSAIPQTLVYWASKPIRPNPNEFLEILYSLIKGDYIKEN